jgi:7-cyano-7-deazaguanine reductase
MNPKERREHLATEPNPDARLDYVVSLNGQAPLMGSGHARAALLYVPDKLILKAGSLARYLEALAEAPWESLEAVAVTVRDDINNEVVPRWLQITVSAPAGEHSHGVMLEDRQPRWDNPALLSRLRRY